MPEIFQPVFKYLFLLSASNSILHSHADNLPATDMAIVKDEEDDKPPHFFFSSYHLNDLEDPIKIWERGLFIWQLYKGASALDYNPNFPYATVGTIKLVELIKETDGNRNITPAHTYELSAWPTFSEVVLNRPVNTVDPYKITQAINKSRSSLEVQQLLFQLGHGLDWVNLHSILDTIEHFSADKIEAVKSLAGVTTNQIKSFTGTANNFGILGIMARHGSKGWGNPKNIVDLPDAQFIILSLCNAYLEEFHGIGSTIKFTDYGKEKIQMATAKEDFTDMDF